MILPRPGEFFEWRQCVAGPALVCRPLEEVAPHLFTTRGWRLGQTRDAGPGAWEELAAAAGVEDSALVRLKQVHGRASVVADRLKAGQSSQPPEADIVVSGAQEKALVVQGADCVPLLIADRRLGVIAAAHAGWRGLALNVPGAAVAALTDAYGSEPRDLVAAIGPSIGACCYEVGADVRQAFVAGGHSADRLRRWFSDEPTPTSANRSIAGLPAHPRVGHSYFDGWMSAEDQLRASGIAAECIYVARLCTASHPGLLCSYRRDGLAAGRIAGVIASRRRVSRPLAADCEGIRTRTLERRLPSAE